VQGPELKLPYWKRERKRQGELGMRLEKERGFNDVTNMFPREK
jgi:hypothetical protein